MLFISPLTDDDAYSDDNLFSYKALCDYLNKCYSLYGKSQLANFTNYTLTNLVFEANALPFIDISFNGTSLYLNPAYVNTTFRLEEITYAYTQGGLSIVKVSNRPINILSSKVSIVRTFFSIACLYYMAYVLENDSKKLILEPLQVMIQVVEEVASDPINAKNLETLQKKIKRTMKKVSNYDKPLTKGLESSTYEIKVIQLAILRISTLLAIGFGEDGGEILRENLGTRRELNPMLQGKKKNAIFGFCDIRGFPDINVALQEKTMVFINEIAEIVHSSVDRFGGAANKNIGDAFLVVWKLDNENEEQPTYYKEVNYNDPHISRMADKAVLSYLHIILKINKDNKLRS
jgi:hypothetical protein